MSWSISYESREKFTKDEPDGSSADLSDAAKEQVVAARKAAEQLIASGVIGDETRDVRVSLNGHANPGHAPTIGWANDCIGIYIYQK